MNNYSETNVVDLLNQKGLTKVTKVERRFEGHHWFLYMVLPKDGKTFCPEEISAIHEIDGMLRATFVKKVASYIRKREVEVFELRIYSRPVVFGGSVGFDKIHVS